MLNGIVKVLRVLCDGSFSNRVCLGMLTVIFVGIGYAIIKGTVRWFKTNKRRGRDPIRRLFYNIGYYSVGGIVIVGICVAFVFACFWLGYYAEWVLKPYLP